MRAERGLLLCVAAPLAIGASVPLVEGWAHWVLLGAGVVLLASGYLHATSVRVGRTLALVAYSVAGVALFERFRDGPGLVVLFALFGLALGTYLTFDPAGARYDMVFPRPSRRRTARGALSVLSLGAIVLAMHDVGWWELGSVGVSLLLAGAVVVRWGRGRSLRRLRRAGIGAALGIAAACLVLVPFRPTLALVAFAIFTFLARSQIPQVQRGPDESLWDDLMTRPARLLVLTFAILAAAGTALLLLPVCAGEDPLAPLDAFFTSVSAVCVTGLIVVDTPTAFSGVGQGVLLVLIQIGGLGIMSFYSVALFTLGRRVSLHHEAAVAGAMNVAERHLLGVSVRRIFAVTLITEGAGALILTGAFVARGDGFGMAFWRGLFTSISAFCNAGFALQSSSLVPYADDPVVLVTCAALLVIGGLSPAAVLVFPDWVRRRRVPLQHKLILGTSMALLLVGTLAFGAMEWSATLEGMPWYDRLVNAFFQSATLRTAGFNSVDLAATRPATQTLMIVLMFIGGSPGGTAGGAKTTTIAILALTVSATLRGKKIATAFGRRVTHATVYKAAAVVTVGLGLALFFIGAVQLTQVMDPEVAVFEVVSALATVGLSIGGTAELDEVGKWIIALGMFAGRVGPLTLFLFLTERAHSEPELGLPEAKVDVG
ncbi:MAG: potassium transporter TrkH [Sandaracinus sp.]|nr:potassium transporter TrkH [Sandaracinus sp.]MAQ16746.1 potassium transporter TrkH [Sandaracinus sp.]